MPVLRRIGLHLLVIAGFSSLGVALFWHAWDGHLGSTLTCACGDAGQEVWFIAWPAYALSHGLDPFYSASLFAPHGLNLLDNASSVAIGVVLTPITLAAGPIVATNVALTLAPALSAWACWVACRRMVRWQPAALSAGLLFGYSPFVVTNLAFGHLGLALLVVPPLLLVAARALLFGSPRRPLWAGIAAGLLLALQFFLSSEVFAILIVVGVPMGLAAVIAGRRRLATPRALTRGLLVATATLAAILAFPIWFALAGPRHLTGRIWQGAPIDGNALSAFVDPGRFGATATTLTKLGGYEGLRGPTSAYLGPLVLGLVVVALFVAWRRRTTWILFATAVLAAVLSLGVLFVVSTGHALSTWTPWRIFGTRPLLDDVIPQRFSVLVDLAAALLAGVGIDGIWHLVGRARGRDEAKVSARRGLVAAGAALGAVVAMSVASLWWTYQVPFVTERVAVPPWYTTVAARLPEGSVVLSVPFPFPADATSGPMVWQALDGMRFRLVGGYAKAPAAGGGVLRLARASRADRVLARLSSAAAGPLPSGTPVQVAAVRRAIRTWDPRYVVVTGSARAPARAVAVIDAALGTTPVRVAHAWVWTLRGR